MCGSWGNDGRYRLAAGKDMSAFDDLTAGLTNVPDDFTLFEAWERSFYKKTMNLPTVEDAFEEGFAYGKVEGMERGLEMAKERVEDSVYKKEIDND